jgi:retron-type reverse transcriptase
MCSIFFDIAAAFDKIWHDGLIYKLIKINLPKFIINWIIHFLSHRFFAVRVNNSITDKSIITTGVPQGAVLSPTLFSIFINDIPINYSRNKCYSLFFADDLCAYFIYKQKRTIVKTIQLYLDRIEKWLKTWRL